MAAVMSGGIVWSNKYTFNSNVYPGTVENCKYLAGTVQNGDVGIGDDTSATVTSTSNEESLKPTAAKLNTIEDVWKDSDIFGRPVFKVNAEMKGEGTKDIPYQIETASDLVTLATVVNNGNSCEGIYFILMNDIDLSGECGKDIGGSEVSWTPIGTNYRTPFNGTFDGGGHEITGLYINTIDNVQGLFGSINTVGVVKNLGVGGTVIGGGNVGGIVGYNNGTIQNCYKTGYVKGINTQIGGIVGASYGGTVQNCYNTGEVRGRNHVGGVVGIGDYNDDEDIIHVKVENCYNTGDVVGEETVGGIVGYYIGYIQNGYNAGTVNGNRYIGGIAGELC